MSRFHTMMSASTPAATSVVGSDAVSACIVSSAILGTSSPGTGPCSVIPKKSLICVLAMTSAMPLVNPMTTGLGMKRTAVPDPVSPMITRTTPAIIVHMNKPSTPYLAMMPDTTTTNAPVGPPIWTYEPPSAEMMKPVTTAQ
jgi:hypothetical protein